MDSALITRFQTRELRLASHVRACRSDDQVILLDLRRGKYLGVGGRSMRNLAASVDGWPTHPLADEMPAHRTADALETRLLAQGLLTQRHSVDRGQCPAPAVPEPVTALGEGRPDDEVTLGTRRVARFLTSAATAAIWLRTRSLFTIVRSVAARKTRLATNARSFPFAATRDAVAAYERLRPLVFTTRDKCLFDSLALVNFLAREHIFPCWVVGVKTHPFGAHSWVQSEGTVLNDLPERVRQFTPILTV